jgi:hypothetical protein
MATVDDMLVSLSIYQRAKRIVASCDLPFYSGSDGLEWKIWGRTLQIGGSERALASNYGVSQ